MKRSLPFIVLMAIIIFGPSRHTNAQDGPLSVAFVTGHDEGGHRLNDLSGFSRLTVIINDVGALVQEITLDGPIPDDIDLIVLNGPKRPAVSDDEISRIWSYIARGGNLLILNDPRPNNGLIPGSALNRLLWQDYGIRWRDDAIIERWFTEDVARVVTRRGYLYQPRRVVGITANPIPGHPISDVIARYSLGVYYWLGRSLEVQGPALRGDPVSLLVSRTSPFGDTPFGETTVVRGFPAFDEEGRSELNIGEDTIGQLILGAAVEDRETGARIAVFGDSDLFKNGYGLEFATGRDSPLYSGNDLLARSTIRWLLGVPFDEMNLTRQYVWISVDGDSEDWSEIAPVFTDSDAVIEEIKVARTDRATYLLIAPAASDIPIGSVYLDVLDSRGSLTNLSVEGNLNVARLRSNDQPTHAFLVDRAIGDAIELRVPFDALPVGELYTIVQVCLTSATADCVQTSISRPNRLGLEPRGRALLPNVPTARVNTDEGATLRVDPNGTPLVELEESTLMNVFETSDDGLWVRVQVEGLEGWVPLDTLQLAFDTSGDS